MNALRACLSFLLLQLFVCSAASLRAQDSVTINLTVDATHVAEKILHSRMVIPVKPGPLTLYYPKWIPGEHQPAGPVTSIAGLKFLSEWPDQFRGGATFSTYSPSIWTFRPVRKA